jgi:hypothetical protein
MARGEPWCGCEASEPGRMVAAGNYYTLGWTSISTGREERRPREERAGLTTAEAYSVASLGADFRAAEAVDSVQLIYGTIPNSYWSSK